MKNELDSILLDVRNAFRLLSVYQARVLDIVNYVKEQTTMPGIWGRKWFSNPIKVCHGSPDSDYASLKIEKRMWPWDFLYGYLFEYYFGFMDSKVGKVDFSIIQVSDDGYFKTNAQEDSIPDCENFATAKDSHTLLLFAAGNSSWMQSKIGENADYGNFLHKFIADEKDEHIVYSEDKKEFFVIKKYDIQRFETQAKADQVIREFGKVLESFSVILFKDSYYQ